MPVKRIPIGMNYQNIDPVEHHDGVAEGHKNAYMTVLGDYQHFTSRLGLSEFATMPSKSQGTFDSIASGKKITVAGGVVYELNNGSIAATYTGASLSSITPCIFAETANYIYIAHGGQLAKVDTTAQTVTMITATGSPQSGATHVTFQEGYILTNGLSSSGSVGDSYYTLDDGVTWGFFNNEKLPDGCNAILSGWEEVYSFGPNSVEVSYNDGVTPWAVLDGAYMQYGLLAPYSALIADNTLFWLGEADGARRIFKMTGRTPAIISNPYSKVLQSLSRADDARAWTQTMNGHTFYVITFPTDDLTIAYNLALDKWCEWTFWDTTTASNKRYLGDSCTYIRDWNKYLIADHTTGTLYFQDGKTDNGDVIRCELTSGRVSYGISRQKKRKRIMFETKRGVIDNFEEEFFTYRVRQDNKAWSNEKTVSLGKVGKYNPFQAKYHMGIYRSAQYQVIFTGTQTEFILMSMEEEFDVLKD